MKKTKPRLSSCFRSTKREDGMPEAVAVEADIASGSGTTPWTLVSHERNISKGDWGTVAGEIRS